MADQRIQYTDEMVGAGHPSKTDTLNKLALNIVDSSGFPRSTAFPGFRAYASSTFSIAANAENAVPFNSELYDFGGNYDSTLSKFVTPTTGRYLFFIDMLITNYSGSSIWEYISLRKNGASEVVQTYAQNHASSGTSHQINFTCIDYAPALSSYYVHIDNRGDASAVISTGTYSVFSCFRIA